MCIYYIILLLFILNAAKDRYGRTLLHLAILYGHVGLVKFLIDQCPDLVKERDNMLRTPIHYACASSMRRQIYGQLVNQAGGDPTAVDVVSSIVYGSIPRL